MSRFRVLGAAGAVGFLAGSLGTVQLAAAEDHAPAQRVLLLSVDGLHQTDLVWYINHDPESGFRGGGQLSSPAQFFPHPIGH